MALAFHKRNRFIVIVDMITTPMITSTWRVVDADQHPCCPEKNFALSDAEGFNLMPTETSTYCCSFSDEGGGAIFGDVQLLSAGYMLIFVFVTVVLGRFNCVQHRVCPTFQCILL